MPDGEFFTGPVEDSAEGEVTFHLPATIGGREVAGVRLGFEAGKVVEASAERGEQYLVSMLDTDEGARRLGELGIGTNFGIERGTRSVLLDEKLGGTVHLAVGASYPETGWHQRERRAHRPGLRSAPRRQARGRRRVAAGERQVRGLIAAPGSSATWAPGDCSESCASPRSHVPGREAKGGDERRNRDADAVPRPDRGPVAVACSPGSRRARPSSARL